MKWTSNQAPVLLRFTVQFIKIELYMPLIWLLSSSFLDYLDFFLSCNSLLLKLVRVAVQRAVVLQNSCMILLYFWP